MIEMRMVKTIGVGPEEWQSIMYLHTEEAEEYVNAANADGSDRTFVVEPIFVEEYVPPTEAGVVVFLEEECGYRQWVWETGMTEEDLLSFWSEAKENGDMETYMLCIEDLPGRLLAAELDTDGLMIFENDKPVALCRRDISPWIAHMHAEDDTYLVNRDNEEE